jgi:hypothetical protein
MHIPTSQVNQDVKQQFYMNKQRHQSHMVLFPGGERSASEEPKPIAIQHPYELALKRRHEAKKTLGQRQQRLKAMAPRDYLAE